MSESIRRNSLQKSSIGIDSIRKSITSLSEGLISLGKQTSELVKETRKSNLLKSNLIRQDAEFFRKRRENVLRKQREDELEETNITGITKRQGNIITKSTRGFLGRMLDFLGTLIVGWALINLPKIIKAFEKLFSFINRVVAIFTAFIEGMRNFFESMGAGIDNFLNIFKRFDFREDDKNIKDTFDKTEQNLIKINKDFSEAITGFANDKDINNAENVAKKLGIDEDSVDAEELNRPSASNIEELGNSEEIEGRAMGGPVEGLEDGRVEPYLVGENRDGTINDTTELFVPNKSGTIIPNDELMAKGEEIQGMNLGLDESSLIQSEGQEQDDMIANDDSPSEIDELLSEVETGTGSKSSSSPPPTSSPGGVTLEEEKKSDPIKGVKTSDADIAITPVSRELINLKKPKKSKTVFIINNQNNIQSQSNPGVTNSGKKLNVSRKKSSSQTVLELQSTLLAMN